MLRPSLAPAAPNLVTAALVLLVAGTGVLDAATGSQVTFGVLYLLLVVAAAVATGPLRASLVAAIAAVVWVVADRQLSAEEPERMIDVVNVGLRFTILLVVVALLTALRTAMERVVASERRSKDFLAYIAHQLRTPTATVTATAQRLLAEGRYPRDDEEALLRLTTEAHRSGRLVGSILRFVRLDEEPRLPQTQLDVDEVVRREVERVRQRAAPVTLEVSAETGSSRAIAVANAEAIQEALGNVIENCVRHAEHGIDLAIEPTRGAVAIVVRDDGAGLPVGAEDSAFAPFTSLDGHGGTGLGLTIARRLVEGQGGSLTYEDGAFVFVLPSSP